MKENELLRLLEKIKKRSENTYRHLVGLIKYMARTI
jgi:hypothetical protein